MELDARGMIGACYTAPRVPTRGTKVMVRFGKVVVRRGLLAGAVVISAILVQAQSHSSFSPEARAQVDDIARRVLASTGVPSASIAIVQDGKIAYLQAYGDAKLEPKGAARPEMRYSIGSISKQFTATAVLMLAEEGKLSLDDPVSRFVPDLTRAKEVTIRELLSHTSGYQDYWPQDYVPPFMLQPVTAEKILDGWARKPLDFDPGTQWQYSNTNFVIAGVIVEKVSGMPLLEFLSKKVFVPLDMKSVINIDQNRLTETDATGYARYALGPLRPAVKEGKGWLFAAGELAMPAEDLAKWDIGIIEQRLLKPDSYREFEREVVLKNGLGARYGLGVDVVSEHGHRALEHGGEVSGFTSENMVFPDDRAAVVVLTNQDSIDTAEYIAREIAPILFSRASARKEDEERARAIFEQLQAGKIDRTKFTENCNAYFTEEALGDFAGSLQKLGKASSFLEVNTTERGGMTFRDFVVSFPTASVEVWERVMPEGKIEQFEVLAR
jgi:D-alanyl-D-alanine carboxypeptidase